MAYKWLQVRGARAIAIAALVPLPYNMFTWIGGMMRLRFRDVFLASLLCIPKTAFYAALLYFGWSIGG